MRNRRTIIKTINCIIAGLILFTITSGADTIHVPDEQPTIQIGLDMAEDGDTVRVAPGTYHETIHWPYVTTGIKLFGSSEYDCFIDGDYDDRILLMMGEHIDTTTVVSGFTLEHGSSPGGWDIDGGGGISCTLASPKLTHLRVRQCNSVILGGGVYIDQGDPILSYMEITDCQAGWIGGGLYIRDSDRITMHHILLTENVSGYGAAMCVLGGTQFASHITITNNYATDDDEPSAIFLADCNLFVRNTILWNNEYCQIQLGSNENYPADVHIDSCDVMGGEESILDEVGGSIFWGDGNIDEDPWFCDTTNFDYRLQLDSPCRTDVCGYMGYTGETCEGEGVEELDVTPSDFFLSQNYPNPFNPVTRIQYFLPQAQKVTLRVYDLSGRLTVLLVDDCKQAGTHEIVFDGHGLASGVYVYQLETAGSSISRKMLLIK
jgi:hypothetical protein